MLQDFHTHTFLSDGVLSPIELIRRAIHVGYRTIAVTDHVGTGNLEWVLKTLVKDCDLASKRWDILALPGVEITHVPKEDIGHLAREARSLGAKIVNVHGETVSEPVENGTNLAAVKSGDVDVLAHPGLLTTEEARIAMENGVALELSARSSHAYANGHIVKIALETGASLVLNSDAHRPEDLLTKEFAMKVALGAGLTENQAVTLLEDGPNTVLRKANIV